MAQGEHQLTAPTSNSSVYRLKIAQEPQQAKVYLQRDKDRKPLEPPPVVELLLEDNDPYKNFLSSPYYFVCLTLHDYSRGELSEHSSNSDLSGTLVSSLHRVKDAENNDVGYFVFQDLSIRREGEFRLKFSLFELQRGDEGTTASYIKSTLSKSFKVYSSAKCPPPLASTFLTKHLQEQGVKLRTKKTQNPHSRRGRRPEEWSSELPRQTSHNSNLSRLPAPRSAPEPYATRFPTTYNPNLFRRDADRGVQATFDSSLAYGDGFYGQNAFASDPAAYRPIERSGETTPKRQRRDAQFPEVDTRFVLGSHGSSSHGQSEDPITPHSGGMPFGDNYFSQYTTQNRPGDALSARTPLTQPRRQYTYADYAQYAAPDSARSYQNHLPNRLSTGSDIALSFAGSNEHPRHHYTTSTDGQSSNSAAVPMPPPVYSSSRQSPTSESRFWQAPFDGSSHNASYHRRDSSGSAIPPGHLLPPPANFQSRPSTENTMQSF